MAEPRKLEPRYCKHCERWLPLTAEFWYRSRHERSGFATNMCKSCRRGFYAERFKSIRKIKKEQERIDVEQFGEFETAALKDQVKRMGQTTRSTDMEIL